MTTRAIRVAAAGSYPRIGDKAGQQFLRRTIDQFEKGRKTVDELREAQDELTREAIRDQVEAGCDLVTDGQIRWYDPISHPLRPLPNVEINGLLRFFDTNTYFRQPVIKGRVGPAPLGLVEEYRFAVKAAGDTPVKPVMTGPYTLALHCIRKQSPYAEVEPLALDLAAVLAEEIGRLAEAGASIIQVDEPAILKRPEALGTLRRALDALASRKRSARLALYTYFGDAAPLYARLHELPVDVLGFDVTYSPKLLDVIASAGTEKGLALGCVDARNTRLEKAADIAKSLRAVRKAVDGKIEYLNPSSGLEYLPRQRAAEKLKVLVEVRKLLAKG